MADGEQETATEPEAPAEPEVDLSTIPAGTPDEDVVKPVELAKEKGIKPQIVFGWIRNMGLPAYKDSKGKNVILRSQFKEWDEAREKRKAEREAKKAEREAAEAKKAEEDAAKAAASPEASAEAAEDEAFS